MSYVAVTAIGADRPGIVARVTKVLVDHGANLADTSMSILRGHFAMLLVVAVPDGVRATDLEADLVAATADLDLTVVVRAIDGDVPESPAGDAYTVSVYGADHPGIVHGVSNALAEAGVNIVDLTTRVIGEAERPVYAMVLDVTLPPDVAPDDVRARLDKLAAELDVSCSLHAADADVL
jgi:glycine cleavage system transcriptional repressor